MSGDYRAVVTLDVDAEQVPAAAAEFVVDALAKRDARSVPAPAGGFAVRLVVPAESLIDAHVIAVDAVVRAWRVGSHHAPRHGWPSLDVAVRAVQVEAPAREGS